MRRWFLLIMLIVLPLQFASAAAATYCRHESNAPAKHFGHHEHQHQVAGEKSSSNSPGDDSWTGASLGDPDCEYCQLGAVHPLLQDFGHAGAIVERAQATEKMLSFGSRYPDTLDRPNWAPLA